MTMAAPLEAGLGEAVTLAKSGDNTSITVPAGAPRNPLVLSASLRERKKSATRLALEEAALRLVADRGLAQVTVDDIADAVNVSPRTFFNYFPSKDAAITGYDPGRSEHLVAALLARADDEEPLDSMIAVMVEMSCQLVDEAADSSVQRSLWLTRLSVIKSDAHLLAGFVAGNMATERELTATLARRLGVDPLKDAYPGLVVAVTMAAARIAAMNWATGEGSNSLVALTVDTLGQLAAGLRRPHPPQTANARESNHSARPRSTPKSRDNKEAR